MGFLYFETSLSNFLLEFTGRPAPKFRNINIYLLQVNGKLVSNVLQVTQLILGAGVGALIPHLGIFLPDQNVNREIKREYLQNTGLISKVNYLRWLVFFEVVFNVNVNVARWLATRRFVEDKSLCPC